MKAEELKKSGRYNWKHQHEKLVYLGKKGSWYRFALVSEPDKVWCEVLDESLEMIEPTQLTLDQLNALHLAVGNYELLCGSYCNDEGEVEAFEKTCELANEALQLLQASYG